MGVTLRKKKLAKGNYSYYLDIYHNGKRFYETLNLHTKTGKGIGDFNKDLKDLAEEVRNNRAIELTANDYQIAPKFKQNTLFSEFYESFLESYRKNDKRMHERALSKFKSFITLKVKREKKELIVTFKNLGPSLISEYTDYLQHDAGLSGDTPHDYYARFKRALNYAKDQNIIKTNPCEGITIKLKGKNSLKKQILTEEELQTLAHTPCSNNESKRAFLFACFTGFGYAEIIKLKWADIQNNKVNTHREKTGEQVWNDLSETAQKLLGKRENPEAPLFNLPSDTAVNKAIKKWVLKARIEKKITFYCGRHAFAVLLLTNGENLKTIADLMGHSTTQHTVKYLNYVDQLKTDAIKNLPSLDI